VIWRFFNSCGGHSQATQYPCVGKPVEQGLYKLRKERTLLSHYKTVVATVSNWSRAERTDGGYSYSVRYRFLGPDGKVYLGESGTTDRALPQEGETISVLYTPGDPTKNRTLATFLFYRFTYTRVLSSLTVPATTVEKSPYHSLSPEKANGRRKLATSPDYVSLH
jgi:hypothetical protein